jgi:hypothetical protein
MLKCISVAIVLSLATSAAASEQSCSFAAIDAHLKAEEEQFAIREGPQVKEEKTGIVLRDSSCPPTDESGMIEYMDHYEVLPLAENINAILIDTHQCGGGNKHGQYFLFSRGEKCTLVTNPEIGDMKFIAESMYSIDNRVVILKGFKWTGEDAHCCPSKEGTLEYNFFDGSYKFRLKKAKR